MSLAVRMPLLPLLDRARTALVAHTGWLMIIWVLARNIRRLAVRHFYCPRCYLAFLIRSLARRHTLTFHDSRDKSAACLSQSSNHASNSEATSGEQSKDQRPFLESCVAPVMACLAASLNR